MYLYTTYVRPKLEYNTCIWSPQLLKDIDKIESVQIRFTKSLPGTSSLNYLDCLALTKLKSLEERPISFDQILVYKIIHGLIDLKFEDFFSFNRNVTRGHSYKLNIQYARVNYRKFFFANRVVHIWNNLPSDLVEKTSLGAFKKGINSLDLSRHCRGRAFMTWEGLVTP